MKNSTPVQEKIQHYLNLNQGQINKYLSKNLHKGILTAALPVLAISNLDAQCQGSAFTNVDVNAGGNQTFLDVDGDGNNDLRFYLSGASLFVQVLSGTVFVTGGAYPTNSALNYASSAAINGAGNTATDKAFLAYNVGLGGSAGNFAAGSPGFIGYRLGGQLGFISFSLNINDPMMMGVPINVFVSVDERGVDNDMSGMIAAGNCSDIGGTVTPVELVSFESSAAGNEINLDWATSSEVNNAGFDVERSMDGESFSRIGFVEGNGTTTQEKTYAFSDADVRAGQLYYYRLKQVDFDGQFEYSNIVSEQLAGNKPLSSVFPNPSVDGFAQLDYTSIEDGSLVLKVFDVSGKELLMRSESVTQGRNLIDLDFTSLGAGMYFMKVEQGIYSNYEKVVIK